MAKRDQTFPDPQGFESEEAFTYAAKVTSIYKKVVSEILNLVDQKVQQADYLEEKEDGKHKDKFAIGGE